MEGVDHDLQVGVLVGHRGEPLQGVPGHVDAVVAGVQGDVAGVHDAAAGGGAGDRRLGGVAEHGAIDGDLQEIVAEIIVAGAGHGLQSVHPVAAELRDRFGDRGGALQARGAEAAQARERHQGRKDEAQALQHRMEAGKGKAYLERPRVVFMIH